MNTPLVQDSTSQSILFEKHEIFLSNANYEIFNFANKSKAMSETQILLELSILNEQKYIRSRKIKGLVAVIFGATGPAIMKVLNVVSFSGFMETSNSLFFWVPLIVLLPLGLMWYAYNPPQGKIIISSDSIEIKLKKKILQAELKKITEFKYFHEDNGKIDNVQNGTWIELVMNGQRQKFRIEELFANETETLKKLMQSWTQQGVSLSFV